VKFIPVFAPFYYAILQTETNGLLWSAAPETWATLQEPFHKPLFNAVLEVGKFAEAGLEVVGEGEVNCPFRYDSVEEHWKACASAGAVQALIDRAGEDKLRTAIDAPCQKLVADDRSVSFDPNVFIYVVAKA